MTLYLVNPEKKMARKSTRRRKTPPRNKDGTFRKRKRPTRRASTKRRRNPARRRSTTRKKRSTVARTRTRRRPARRRTTTRRPARRRSTTRRRNPDFVKMLTKGTKGAAYLLVGEAATKAIPSRIGLPTTGAAGLAVKAATALGAGMLADNFMGREAGARVLEGGIAVVLRELIVGAGIPVVSGALSSYASTPIPAARFSRGTPARAPRAFASYANMGLNGYATNNGGSAVVGGA